MHGKIDGIPQSMIVGKAAVYFSAHSRSDTCRSLLCRNFAKKMSTCSKEATANEEMIKRLNPLFFHCFSVEFYGFYAFPEIFIVFLQIQRA